MMAPGGATSVKVAGGADILQISLTRELIETVGGRAVAAVTTGPASSPTREKQLQALATRALVALSLDDAEAGARLSAVVRDVASRLFAIRAVPPSDLRGGLSTGARRRVRELIEGRLAQSSCRPPSLAELAATARLSPFHFSRAFRQSEGATSQAHVLACRFDQALRLLLQAQGRVADIADMSGFKAAGRPMPICSWVQTAFTRRCATSGSPTRACRTRAFAPSTAASRWRRR